MVDADDVRRISLSLPHTEVLDSDGFDYDGAPLVMVRLATIDMSRLTELVTDAWHMRAPAELGVRHPQEGGRRQDADAMAEDRGARLAAGLEDYLAKPVSAAELKRILARVNATIRR